MTLSNGSDTIGMTVKYGDTTVMPGDEIDTFSPSTLNSSTSADFIVLAIEPDEKPEKQGTYSGNLNFICGVVED